MNFLKFKELTDNKDANLMVNKGEIGFCIFIGYVFTEFDKKRIDNLLVDKIICQECKKDASHDSKTCPDCCYNMCSKCAGKVIYCPNCKTRVSYFTLEFGL